MMANENIFLVGIDGSECSLRALDMALDLAKTSKANVICAYAMWLPGFEVGMVQAGGYAGLPQDYVQINETERDRVFEAVDKHIKGHDVAVTKVSDIAAPVTYIKDLIEEYQPKILFLGKQGRSTLGDILVGSVSNRLAHTCSTPVMLVS